MPKAFPEVFYGLHMVPGVAEYRDGEKDPYRILVGESTCKNMDPSFAGKPLYVQHVDEVDLENLKNEADGYVVESFFNQYDGMHWSKFIAITDEAKDAIKQKKWKLSNSYVPQSFIAGGQWHGVDYSKEVTSGEYEHLALVPNPRYEESVIMTPEEFKQYNEEKKAELKKLSNSKEEKKKMGLKFFKRAKVDNEADLAAMSVVLPKSGKEVTIEKLVNDADKMMQDGNKGMADSEHKVKLHDGSYCNVGELVEKHKSLHDELEEMKKKKEDSSDEDGEKDNKEDEGDDKVDKLLKDDDGEEKEDNEEDDAESEKDNEEDDGEEDDKDAKKKALELAEHEEEEIEEAKKKKNSKSIDASKKKAAKEKADKLRNAHLTYQHEETAVVEIMQDQIERGKQRYGS